MAGETDIDSLLVAARRTIDAAGCASLVTLDETGAPSSRAVAAFPPDDDFARIVVGTHPGSRKTVHVHDDPRVLVSYIDNDNRGYLTVIGRARIEDDTEQKKAYWVDRFSAFFPAGPESDDYQLMVIEPERLEIRSFGLEVAHEPTQWHPVVLERGDRGAWRHGQ